MRQVIYLLFLLPLIWSGNAYGANAYGCTGLTGNGTGDLDALDITGASSPNADNLADGDIGLVFDITGTDTISYVYIFDADGTDAESSPDVIRPDDYSTQGVWRLSTVRFADIDFAFWDAGGMTADGTQCADATKQTINSGPAQYTVICTDNDASTLYGHVVMPDNWDAGDVTFVLEYVQTAADTNALNSDVAVMCRGAGETINNTWGSEVAIDDAGVTGSNAVDHTESAAVTPNGTCAAGDTLYWRWQMDATGTTTAVATLHILGMRMEFGVKVGE